MVSHEIIQAWNSGSRQFTKMSVILKSTMQFLHSLVQNHNAAVFLRKLAADILSIDHVCITYVWQFYSLDSATAALARQLSLILTHCRNAFALHSRMLSSWKSVRGSKLVRPVQHLSLMINFNRVPILQHSGFGCIQYMISPASSHDSLKNGHLKWICRICASKARQFDVTTEL